MIFFFEISSFEVSRKEKRGYTWGFRFHNIFYCENAILDSTVSL
jgi:hypothetical protein